jgi:electron transport complex protein RnfC
MDDLIQAAMARAAARKASPEQQQAKLERGLEAAKNRLSVAEGKLQEAIGSNAGDEQRDKLQVKVDEARLKLTDAERKLAEFSVETNPSDLAYQAEKIVTKIQTSPRHQAEENIATLHKKIATTEQKIAQADNAETRAALEKGLEKLQQKLADAQQALGSLAEDADKAVDDPPALDAAAAAIARAQAKAQAQATMSPQQKLDAALASLQARIEKSRHKLALAESEQSEHSDTLRAALEKLEAKYAATESERQQLAQQGETE